MILLPDIALTDAAAVGLRELQAEVNAAGPYADQVAEGKRLFGLREAVRRRQHPTVWREMLRQREKLPALQALFADVPEAAAW